MMGVILTCIPLTNPSIATPVSLPAIAPIAMEGMNRPQGTFMPNVNTVRMNLKISAITSWANALCNSKYLHSIKEQFPGFSYIHIAAKNPGVVVVIDLVAGEGLVLIVAQIHHVVLGAAAVE